MRTQGRTRRPRPLYGQSGPIARDAMSSASAPAGRIAWRWWSWELRAGTRRPHPGKSGGQLDPRRDEGPARPRSLGNLSPGAVVPDAPFVAPVSRRAIVPKVCALPSVTGAAPMTGERLLPGERLVAPSAVPEPRRGLQLDSALADGMLEIGSTLGTMSPLVPGQDTHVLGPPDPGSALLALSTETGHRPGVAVGTHRAPPPVSSWPMYAVRSDRR